MPSKLDFYAQMADHTAKQVTGSFGEWTAFLETMCSALPAIPSIHE